MGLNTFSPLYPSLLLFPLFYFSLFISRALSLAPLCPSLCFFSLLFSQPCPLSSSSPPALFFISLSLFFALLYLLSNFLSSSSSRSLLMSLPFCTLFTIALSDLFVFLLSYSAVFARCLFMFIQMKTADETLWGDKASAKSNANHWDQQTDI